MHHTIAQIREVSGKYLFFYFFRKKKNEPAHDKTYNKTCLTSKDSDQSVHPLSMARVLVYSSLDSLEALKGTFDQQRL